LTFFSGVILVAPDITTILNMVGYLLWYMALAQILKSSTDIAGTISRLEMGIPCFQSIVRTGILFFCAAGEIFICL
jgi:hypothetical protein